MICGHAQPPNRGAFLFQVSCIHDAQENTFLHGLAAGQNVWVGLSDAQVMRLTTSPLIPAACRQTVWSSPRVFRVCLAWVTVVLCEPSPLRHSPAAIMPSHRTPNHVCETLAVWCIAHTRSSLTRFRSRRSPARPITALSHLIRLPSAPPSPI